MEEEYIVGGILIGLVVTLDGALLLHRNGLATGSKVVAITSFIEFVWAIVSVIALFTLQFSRVEILSPVLFVSHNVFGWAYGLFLARKSFFSENQEFAPLELPIWYVVFGLTVGVVYTLVNIYLATI